MLKGFSGGIIVAVVDFIMVFVVLGGLAGVIVGLQRFVAFWQANFEETPAAPTPQTAPAPPQQPAVAALPAEGMKSHIAAMLAALCEFTLLEPGTFKIDKIVPLGAVPVGAQTITAPLSNAQIAAIALALHEYTSQPMGSLRITGIKHLGRATTWKTAGRLEQMGLTQE
ncbi:hypothetical protein CSA56_13910 [candidate division KSB3 bacterium]|uniref:Uncharacterized protein n=1 Tax=candidate division KSB3 bacterium TaxID=2044937 RepID=A0A2G6KB52_9BACT|nr:MAG: hypothetical protein CSA56_13910 [candidate division KSB3 bacterium]